MNELLDRLLTERQERWLAGDRVSSETYLAEHPELQDNVRFAVELIYGEMLLREDLGESVRLQDYLDRFPQYAEALDSQFDVDAALLGLIETMERRPDASCADANGSTIVEGPRPRRTRRAGATRDLPHVPGYEVLDWIGNGARGVVYEARQVSLNRPVALKMIREDAFIDDPEGEALFRREAETVARLNHPHIVQVYDFGAIGGRPYFAMELLEGGSLEQELEKGPWPAREAAGLIEQLARALHVVHEQEIVHRDLKPANVLLTPGKSPKLADFGLAKWLDQEASQFASGAIIGTASYMAPEQASGQGRTVGPHADVWALGVILHECLSGQPAFRGKDIWETLNQVRFKAAPSLRPAGVPRDLETICSTCLRKNAGERYASALELAEDLRRFRAGEPIKGRPLHLGERIRKVIRSHPRLLAASVLLFLALAGTLLAAYLLDPNRERKKTEARLAAGLPYEFEGNEKLPGPFRWSGRELAAPAPNGGDDGFTLEAAGLGLYEFVADPGPFGYRFTAQVRHEAGKNDGSGQVGIYFGFRRHHDPELGEVIRFFPLAFADRGKRPADRMGHGGLHDRVYENKSGRYALTGQFGPDFTFKRDRPLGERSPWRTLSVEVTAEGAVAKWKDEDGNLKLVGQFSAADFIPPKGPQLAFPRLERIPMDFSPRAGLGLYLSGGSASFRRIRVEPFRNSD